MSAQNLLPNFSHIYIEKGASGYPLTKLALEKFPKSTILWIEHYKDIFNRIGQDFQSQKLSMKLILAKKTDPLLYPASDMIQEYNTPNVYYITPVLNCLYNCDYCFLQGMYNSGNIVVFVNEDDLKNAIDNKLLDPLDSSKPTVVSISYNTDLLAMENIFPLTRNWITYIKNKPNLIIEIRTKSALFSAIQDIKPVKNIILSWTLSPATICNKYEKTAPPLKSRVKNIKKALDLGWSVRLCFDPILLVDNWYEDYSKFLITIFNEIKGEKIRDITFGVFRMNKDYFNRIRKRDPNSNIYYADYALENNTVLVDKKKREEALDLLKQVASEFISVDKILIWK